SRQQLERAQAVGARARLYRRAQRLRGDECLAAPAGHDQARRERRQGAGQPQEVRAHRAFPCYFDTGGTRLSAASTNCVASAAMIVALAPFAATEFPAQRQGTATRSRRARMIFYRGWGILVLLVPFAWIFLFVGIMIGTGYYEPDEAKAAVVIYRFGALAFAL